MKCYLNEMEALSQTNSESYADGKSTSRSFSIMQHLRTPQFHHRVPPRQKTALATLTRPLWMRCALPSHSISITEPLERIASQRTFTRLLDSLGRWRHRVITNVLLCETVPNNSSEIVLLPLSKKGNKRICSNYRDISLIDVAKVFGDIPLKRFQSERDQRIRLNQSGFRPGRGCTDQPTSHTGAAMKRPASYCYVLR